jgi:hypothetical protein
MDLTGAITVFVKGDSMKWALFVLLACPLLLPSRAESQSLDKSVLNSAVWITYEDDPHSDAGKGSLASGGSQRPEAPSVIGGTGFLLFQGLGYTKGQIYLITNKHVLPKEGKPKSIKIRVAVREQNGKSRVENVSIPIVGADGKYLNSVRLHPNPDTDVAAVNITPAALGAKLQLLVDAVMSHKCLDVSMLMTSERLKNSSIDAGAPVYVVGFPAALFDPRNVSPLVRIGYISTDPREGFSFNEALRRNLHFPEHIDGFLVDANVYPGSSGSLVLLAGDPLATTGDTAKGGKISEPTILGIVGGSIPIFDESLQSYERIGLGLVYSADTIREVIQSFEDSRH